jgi:Ca2+-binding EF-hand superfamily protein
VGYFRKKVRIAMFNYLNTEDGKFEVNLIVKELEKDPQYHVNLTDYTDLLKDKKRIYAIFQRYDADGSDSIDKNELIQLFQDLSVKFDLSVIEQLIKSLGMKKSTYFYFNCLMIV